jgi:hypothetical protein
LKYTRAYSSNVAKEDTFITKKQGVDRLADEVFNDVKSISIVTDEGTYKFTDKNADEIRESYNYYAIFKDKSLSMIKYSLVKKIEISF